MHWFALGFIFWVLSCYCSFQWGRVSGYRSGIDFGFSETKKATFEVIRGDRE